ncbi:AEC family transporter [Ruminococcaceae bacterium OttesenSCG-928-L11]|nr:AEC family transporter [Ruminococcaceae bacterium OttesenSCG-928-L11]
MRSVEEDMWENLLFSLDRVMPFFLLILLGYGLKRLKILPEAFLGGVNKYVYRVALPANLFYNTCRVDVDIGANLRFLGVTALLILLSFSLIWVTTELCFRDKTVVGTLVQGSFRGNFSLLGVPLATAVVGANAAAPAAMAIAVVIPCYAILSVIVLTVRGKQTGSLNLKKILLGVLTTPLFIGTIAGILVSALRIPVPGMLYQTAGYVSGTATPLGLMAIGGLFTWKDATARLKPALYAAFIKLLLLPLVMVSICYILGFRGETLFLYFVIFGAPVAVSSYSVAGEMGGDAPLAGNILILTTLVSSLTLASGIYLMRTLGWI